MSEAAIGARPARRLELALVLAGAVLLVTLVLRTGVGRILADVSQLGWGFALVLASEIPVIAVSALGWRYAIAPQARRISLLRLGLFRTAGEAVNHLTPTATLGGEFVRARLAIPYVGAADSASSVTLAKFTETTGQYVFAAAGLLLFFGQLGAAAPHPAWLVLLALACAGGVALLVRLLRRGLFTTGANLLGRIERLRHSLLDHQEHIYAIDRSIREGIDERPRDLVISTLLLALGFSLRAVEVWIVLAFLGLPATLANCVGIEVLSVLINSVFFFMPGKVGTQEGGKMLIFGLLGLPPEKGLVLGLVRRGREIGWDLFGLLVYAAERRRLR